MPKKILFISHVANFQKFNWSLMKELKKNGWIVDYASSGEETVQYCDHEYKIRIDRSPLSLANIGAIFELRKLLTKNHYDLVHCHTPMGGVVARLANFLAGKYRTKIIYTAHGFHFYKGAPLINWLLFYPIEKILATVTTAIVTINQEDYQLAKQKFKTRIFKIDGVGINLERFMPITKSEKRALRKQYGYGDDDFIMIYVAEVIKRKNHLMIVRKIDKILDKIPNLKFIFAGKDTNRYIYRQICKSNKIDFLGYRKDVDKLFQLSDVAITTSLQEGLATNIIEAMASGLPVICSNVRGHRELIQNDENGYLFELNDDSEMIDNIVKIYNNHELCAKFSRNNIKMAKSYDQAIATKKMMKIYNEVLND
ncbi:MAG: glycosyltransferase family 4 protein [Candidatus Saccharibacteria bacterium]|nr:glycosyltransferase family 4 protein [Candidatus Saccharibacteria bacterium]